jgi:hypothetical protein
MCSFVRLVVVERVGAEWTSRADWRANLSVHTKSDVGF